MVGSSNFGENGSASSVSQASNGNAVITGTTFSLIANHNNYPTIPWLTESWLSKLVPYERIATASPRIGMGIIATGLIEHHVNLLPTLHSPADFVHVHDRYGQSTGVRPKMATWPLTKKEVLCHKEWAA
ncbi:hypothetical protein GE09DRAFT_116227 [Coniochaeta sp. 2T2.1]|nr:hypothetical protein GE09DRAFT_116227 [Coniochaeta sp. 2T2.1]